MLVYFILVFAAFIFFYLMFKKVTKPDLYEVRAVTNTPTRKDACIGDNAEEAIRREKAFKVIRYIVCYTFLGVFALFMVIPFYWMIVTSLKTESEISLTVPTFYPHVLALSNYPIAIERLNAGRLIFNTVLVGAISTIGTLVTTVFAAFAFARIKFKGREIIFTIFLATMMIPGEMMVISNYITVSKFSSNKAGTIIGGLTHLGKNSYWSMIIPFLISVYYIYLLRQNFRQIPDELYYAAKVDGTSDLKYLFKIMVPIASPTLITISILKMMGAWNSYVWPMLITSTDSMRPITVGLRQAFKDNSEGRSIQGQQMAGTVVVTAPLLLVFIFLRKYIMRGVGRSGIKG